MATPRMTSGFRLLPVNGSDAGAVVAVVSPTAIGAGGIPGRWRCRR